ncbi:MAG TPA: twin-arginine translocase subunit TatC [Chloroflexota bacterium]|nr:twin-arginine translocase subunit TatC [Chloroflexota bacterium]
MTLTETSPAPITPSPNGQTDGHAPGDKEMTLLQHLEELRGRLVAATMALVVGIIVAIIPVPGLGSITQLVIDALVGEAKATGVLIQSIRPGETFFSYLEVALVVGAAVAMPMMIYQVLAFVTPALYEKEKKYLYLAVPGVFFSFACGVAFCYFLTLPFAIRFLAGFLSTEITPQWSFERYVDFVSSFLFWVGLAFELPIVMFFLVKLGVVSVQRLVRFRKIAFVLAFVLGAAITPTPDPINQTIISLPIYFLFEIGVLLARFA